MKKYVIIISLSTAIIIGIVGILFGTAAITDGTPDECSIPGATDPRCGASPTDTSERNKMPEDCVLDPKHPGCASPDD